MAAPREAKKADTRARLMRETARLVITQGTERTTVADVAAAVGVSARTFHNYFTSREEALEEFAATRAILLKEELRSAGSHANLIDTVEGLVLDSLTSAPMECVDNIVALSRVCTILETLQGEYTCPLTFPEDESGDFRFAFQAIIAIAWAAVDAYHQLPEPRDPSDGENIVREAFGLARRLSEIEIP
ncbi:TetR family transcriptional regulator [Corynebacterium breve]|uniref:TetR family transcriptional regulator n=1 Tax=Corynebacterium breve TaxID=3049799 RepID=A0ABY8VGZ5_9CORY|nr:TetR family transcriptional regulator [Corynebacterium breve]WIM68347.1 TetR family transcriptional regulator [Corynebacterium breve]